MTKKGIALLLAVLLCLSLAACSGGNESGLEFEGTYTRDLAGTKLNVASSATANSTQVGKILAIDVVGKYTYYVVLVA